MTRPAAGEENVALPRSSFHTVRLVILLMLVVGLGHFNRVGIKVAGDARIISDSEDGISATQFGTIISAFLLTYTLAMVPGGWFIDRFGPRRALGLLLFGSTAFVFLTAAVGFLGKTPTAILVGLLIVRSLMGIVNAPLHPGAATMVFCYAPTRMRSLINGLVTFAAVVGVASTFYGFGSLIDRFDWPQSFVLTGTFTLIVGFIWWIGTGDFAVHPPFDRASHHRSSNFYDIVALFKNRSVMCLTLSYVALGYFQYVFFYWIEHYFENVLEVGTDRARWNSTLITLAMGVAMAFGGLLIDRLPASLSPNARRRLVPFVGLAGSGAIIVWLQLSNNTSLLLPAFVASAALLGACEAAFWTTANELGGKLGGTTGGFMNAGGNAGGVISPTLTPWLSAFFGSYYGESFGWRVSLAVAGTISILGAAFWLGVTLPSDEEPFDDDAVLPGERLA